MKKFIIAAFASLLAVPAMAASLTLGTGQTGATSAGATTSQSQSASGAAIIGLSAGQTSGNAASGGVAGATNFTGPASNSSGAFNLQQSSTQTNTASGALGAAITANGSGANAGNLSGGIAAGQYGTAILAPIP